MSYNRRVENSEFSEPEREAAMTTTTSTQTIRFSHNTEASLFDNADTGSLAGIDLAASIEKFENILTERIQAVYPEAEVSADADRSNGYWATGFGEPQDDIDAAYVAQTIAEDLYNDGNLWMVELGAMATQPLTYDSRDRRYHGVQSDGTPIQIDGDAFAEARQEREAGGMSFEDALAETADPDGWSEDMAGWIPAGEEV